MPKGIPSTKLSPERLAMYRKLRAEGRTYTEIGKRFNANPTTIRKALNKSELEKLKSNPFLRDIPEAYIKED